ncbi:transposase [Hydrogenimonas sp.]
MKERYSSIENGPKSFETDRCVHCHSPRLYRLADGRVRCGACRRRYSPKKVARTLALAKAFCDDLTALEASRRFGIGYVTAKKGYDRIRSLLLPYLEACYANHREAILEYDEYLYLDHTKRRDKRFIFDAHNFLTFDYGGRVYNILMPSLSRYKQGFLDDGLESLYYDEFSKFLKIHRIARLRSIDNTIVAFWRYFDDFMKRYKGVERERFIYYLKEAEFKFNEKSGCYERLRALLFPST